MWGAATARAWDSSSRLLVANAPGLSMSLLLLTAGCSFAQGHLWGWLFLGPRAAVPESARGGCNRGWLCTGEGCNALTSALVHLLRNWVEELPVPPSPKSSAGCLVSSPAMCGFQPGRSQEESHGCWACHVLLDAACRAPGKIPHMRMSAQATPGTLRWSRCALRIQIPSPRRRLSI